ncbi:MAG: potassium/proton antiporter [Opitutales bacterium]|nr:potassium/proton antiporter [Opitutales bacterium]
MFLASFDFISITTENILFFGSILLSFSVFAGKAGYKTGIPVLLLFLGVGMLFGYLGIAFDNAEAAQFIGVIALSIILFSGGMDTRYEDIKPVWKEGVLLATIGVMLTALITGSFIYAISNTIFGEYSLSFAESMLLASVMASTDSASVFSLLRSKGLNIDKRLRSTLELESGSNDPMAYMLTILFIQIIESSDFSWQEASLNFLVQMSVGAVAGLVCGRLTIWLINRLNVANQSLYSILMLSCILFTFSAATALQGNGYLAVYLAGLIAGNEKFAHKRAITSFFESFAWLWQIAMFLTLGLLVNAKDLPPIMFFGLAVGFFMITLGRPLSVLLCLLPFSIPKNQKFYISWVGLKGAVPIIFATYPMLAKLDHSEVFFNVVFFITIISLLIQGSTVGFAARKLSLTKEKPFSEDEFGIAISEDIKSTMSEIVVSEKMLSNGKRLMDMPIPENTLAVMVKRSGNYFVPRGSTELNAGDKVLVISDNAEELEAIYKKFGIENFKIN